MALRVIESFDHLTTQAQLVAKGWGASLTVSLEAAQGRRSTGNVRLDASNGGYITRSIPSAHASGVVGFALSTDKTNAGFAFVHIVDGGTVHLELDLSASAKLQIRLGAGGAVLATGTTTINVNTYYYIEIKFTIDDTTGSVAVRLNGSGTDELSFAGDTRNAGNASWTGLRLRGRELSGSSPLSRFDDIYLCDGVDSTATHGLANNDFLGDVRVDAFRAETGNGTNTDFTPSTGTDRGALVDESSPNDDTDYNSGTAVNQIDTYTLPALGFVPAIIFGVQGVNCTKKTDAGLREIADVLYSGGANYVGATSHVLSTSYASYCQMWESDPATSTPWNPAAVNALQHGVKVTV